MKITLEPIVFLETRFPRWRCCLIALIAVWGIIYYTRTFDQKLLLGDEGVALMNGWRISTGETPHKDFFVFIPPASFLPTAMLFKLFGPSLLISRLLAFALAVLLVISLDLLLRRLGADLSLRILSLSLLIPFGVSYWPIPSHHWWCDIYCLLSAYCFLRAVEDTGSLKGFASAAGVFLSLAVFSLQDQGGYFLLLTAFFFFPAIPSLARKRTIIFSALGFGAVSALFALWLIPLAGIGKVFSDLFVFPLSSYHGIEGHKADLLAGWRQFFPLLSGSYFGRAPLYLTSMTIIAGFLLILPVLSACALTTGMIRKSSDPGRLALAAAVSLSFFGAALHRWSFTNMVWALPGLLAALALLPVSGRTARVFRSIAAAISITAILFSICFFSLAAPDKLVIINTEAGSLRVFNSPDAKNLRELLGYLEANGKDADTLFCSGFKGLINVLTLMKNPTPFNDFLDYNTDEHLEALERALASDKARWVCMPKTAGRTDTRLAPIIASGGYVQVFENGQYILYRSSN